MRRLIASLPGKILSQVVVMALVLPYLAFGLATRGQAQLKQLPSWAVIDFVNKMDASKGFGAEAAKAVASSLVKTGKYDVQAQDSVARTVESLNLVQPLGDINNILRVASEL